MANICGDNRFEIISEAKKDLLATTNIEMASDEMAVLDDFLFRCWQMGWLRQYEMYEFCSDGENPCKEYDKEKHCCHRWTKVIRQTIDEVKANAEMKVTDTWKVAGCHELNAWCPNCEHRVTRGCSYCPTCGVKLDWSERDE